jgi:hypothetical protein
MVVIYQRYFDINDPRELAGMIYSAGFAITSYPYLLVATV